MEPEELNAMHIMQTAGHGMGGKGSRRGSNSWLHI